MKVNLIKARELINDSKKILILVSAFVTPDGDSLGSSLGLYYIIKQALHKKVEVKSAFKTPKKFDFLPGASLIKYVNPVNADLTKYDLVITCDAASESLVVEQSKYKEYSFPQKTKTLSIDHHKTGKLWATYNLVDTEAAATGEIIIMLFKPEIKSCKNAAKNLLTALITDTGHFRWHLSSKTFRLADFLLRNGANMEFITQNLYFRDSIYTFELIKRGIERLEWSKDHSYTYTYLSYDDLKNINGSEEQFKPAVDLIVNQYSLSLENSKFGVTFLETDKNVIKVEFRGKYITKFDLSKFAKHFGGGGHKYASGFTTYGVLKETIDKVITFIDKSRV